MNRSIALITKRPLSRWPAAVVMSVIAVASPLVAQDIGPEYLMMSSPELGVPVADLELPEGTIKLWRQSLKQSESDLLKAAADSVATAHAEGFPGLDTCRPELIAALKAPDLHPVATYALCHALIVLDSSEAADLLFATSQQGGMHLRMLIEPALAEWDDQPIRDVWRSRLEDPETHRRELLLACAGVGQVHDESAIPLLVDMVRSQSRPNDLRLAAARAAGRISTSGLEADAALLVGLPSSRYIDELCAISLLRQHSSAEAQRLLAALATHENSTIAAPALRSLLEIDPELVLPLADDALQDNDPKVRQCGLDAYVALANEERLPLIAEVMDDVHPDVRTSARQAMYRFSQVEQFREQVLELAMTSLSGPAWRGQEQAAILLVALDHKAAATQLVKLLASDRPEVMITTAWGLRVLAVPETADGILKKVKRETIGRPSIPYGDRQVGHLFEACAVLGDERAIPVMRQYVPKDVTREKSRSAAIWAMGRLLEGQPDDELAAKLTERIKDVKAIVEELRLVRQMSAITIGRMKAESQLNELKRLVGSRVDAAPVEYAMGWAIEQMTGEPLPKSPPLRQIRRGWLIEPTPSQNAR